MTTAKESCNIIISLLSKHGISEVVVSPGSRNAPLVIAAARSNELNCHTIVDERSAAFVALGMCAANNGEHPIALVCTSGTALLNYAPAIAEAYYRKLPLIVISADRPAEWIDQDDSQTLRQFEALGNYVKKSYNIPSRCCDNNMRWYVNRLVNDAIINSMHERKGPVHLNVQLDEPLNELAPNSSFSQRVITMPLIKHNLPNGIISQLANDFANSKVLIICGFQNECDKLWHSSVYIDQIITNLSNVAFITETIANEHSKYAIANIDRTLSDMTDDELLQLQPHIVITYGGALVSRHIKQYLRKYKPQQHWHIGITDTTVDCFQSLTTRIGLAPAEFFMQLSQVCSELNTVKIKYNYYQAWNNIAIRAKQSHNNYIERIGWSDMKAFSLILPHINGDLHLSNGTPIRYQQLFDAPYNLKRSFCNRGVSGIDGSTSTAIGHAMTTQNTTILITGDLSAQYDISALSINNIPCSFKMIVMCNGGGGIFRFIKSTSELPELEEFFATKPNLPLEQLAYGYNFAFYSAHDELSLKSQLPLFLADKSRPAILAIYTPAKESAIILKEYFKRNNI